MFGAGAVSLVIAGIQAYVLLEFPLLHPRRAMNVLTIAVLTIAAVSGRESVHKVIVVIYAIVLVLFFSIFVFDPDSWALQR